VTASELWDWRRVVRAVLTAVAVLLATFIAVFPIYWMLVTAMQPDADLFQATPNFLPNLEELSVFGRVFTERPVGKWMLNSFLVSAGAAGLSLLLSVTTAYALSRFRFAGKGFFGFILIFTQMVPTVLLMVPLFILFARTGVLNTRVALVLVNTAFITPITIWILKGYYDSIPIELEEAAMVDGCTRIGALVRIVLPLARPALVASLVIAFFEAWNEFGFAVTFVQDQDLWVTSVGLASWIGWLTVSTDVMMAGAIVFSVPSLLFFLFLQRFLVSGLAAGAVRG
jgi:multiple sugar transport system permease protein